MAFLAADVHTPIRVAAALLLFCLAPGATLLSLLTPRGARLELGLVVASSLAALTVLAEVMLALGAWKPTVFTYLVAAACAPVVARQLAPRGLRAKMTLLDARRLAAGLSSRAIANPRAIAAHVSLLGGAMAIWGLSLEQVDLRRLSGFGLASVLPVTYYLALALVAAGFVLAISQRAISATLLGAYVVGLVVVLYSVTPLLYPEPRYTWTYKHLGVINYIALHGDVHRQTDIFSNWPGFFALNAWFKGTAGIAPISYAAWAQVFFELANASALLFVARGLTADRRLQWTTVWIFLGANWVGQDYLAPQALGFLLVLAVLGLCLRYTPKPSEPRSDAERRWRALLRTLGGRHAVADEPAGLAVGVGSLSPAAALFVGTICTVAVVVSHQLSPIMLGAGLVMFAVVTGRLRASLLVALGCLETGWVILAWPYLSAHLSLFSFDLLARPRPTGYDTAQALPGVAHVADITHALVAAVILFALCGVILQRRAAQLQLPALALLVAPLPVFIAARPYGGEVILRVFLFSLPWLAFFIAVACLPSRSTPRIGLLRYWKLAAASLVIGVGFVFANFGLEKINYVTADDVAAASWYERNAPADSVMGYVAGNFPAGLTADYSRVRVNGTSYIPQLVESPEFRRDGVTARNFPSLVALLRGAGAPHTYFVVSPTEENFVRLYGLLPPGSLGSLRRLLESSPDFRVAYRHGRAVIFELVDDGRRVSSLQKAVS